MYIGVAHADMDLISVGKNDTCPPYINSERHAVSGAGCWTVRRAVL